MSASRNELCPCGSGKKYKRCCLLREQQSVDNSARLMQAVQLHQAGQLDGAEKIYRAILADVPNEPDALHYLGMIAFQRADYASSVQHISRAISIKPGVAPFYCNLANSLKRLGKKVEAESAYCEALRLDQYFVIGLFNYGIFLLDEGRAADALKQLSVAVKVSPNHAQAWYQLGRAWYEEEQIDEAASCFRKALTINANLLEAHQSLASILLRFGDNQAAIAHFQQALRIQPNNKDTYQSYLMALNYANLPNQQVFAAHQHWQQQFIAGIQALPKRELGDITQRRIKIAYISADFRLHALRFFIRPILRHHDKQRFEVYCYSLSPREDAETARLKTYADHWLACAALDDLTLAQQIRQDEIDVLIDLSGHTSGNRLTALAYQPAPVQMTMLGYMNTTGMDAIQYRISDAIATPDSLAEYYSEKVLHMPHSQWCYQPDENMPACADAPCRNSAEFIFAAFHNTAKISAEVLQAWCAILQQAPHAKLMVVAWGKEAEQRLQKAFNQAGIAAERLILLAPKPYQEYLSYYQQADLTLDTFPYAGGTVSCESLWMGVPFVSYAANSVAGRGGASILAAVGLSALYADTLEGYINLAVKFAHHPEQLLTLREGLRERVAASPLADGEAYTRALERHYLAVLQNPC